MTDLTPQTLASLAAAYRRRFGLGLLRVSPEGCRVGASRRGLDDLDILAKARADALQEGLRWGETYTFFLAPGILSWVCPIVDGACLLGGLIGGEVRAGEDGDDLRPAISYLQDAGCTPARASRFVRSLRRWPQARIREAAEFLYTELYRVANLRPQLLERNREHAQQQRQIAEGIHELKGAGARTYSYEGEQALLSLIRVGDKPGARRLLNKVLAGMFLHNPRVVMVQAYAIEMMGYLVRVAVENSPVLESLLESHRTWIERILRANNFESLCWELREILDAFMDTVYLQGYNRTNRKAQEILDVLATRYREGVTLSQVGEAVGLSAYRVAHVIKEATGKTLTQHVRQMRIREAQKLLLHTDLGYADIAYRLGFSDQSYFIRQFRALTGTTPARYRRGLQGD